MEKFAPDNMPYDPAHTESEELRPQALSPDTVQTIERLKLSTVARVAAEKLVTDFPGEILFTSGRRTLDRQARAMAGNVVDNRRWIEQTYKSSNQRKSLQDWVDKHPEAVTRDAISQGLKSVMKTWQESELMNFSRHMTGHAFDIRPVAGDRGENLKQAIPNLPNIQWFTFKEGGKEIWHAQFDNPIPA